ncbi:MAG TPA: Tol-Pal system beta propeller repeat protein TolB [Gammaproteobacteria bacterium]|nr:Tol-Pal system beta propeller repeat protein TolB [Gammaproteobacteria bacterium]
MRLILILFGLMSVNASAVLTLELTQGVPSAVPVQLKASDPSANMQRILKVIQHDLKTSGYVDPLSTKPELVVHLKLEEGSKNILTVNIDEASVESGTHIRSTIDYQEDLWRAAAHKASDAIFLQATGYQGIFSTRLAYVLIDKKAANIEYKLQVSDFDGQGASNLLTSREPIMSPAWSPDGKYLVYVSFEGKRASIWKQTIDSGEREVLAEFPGINGAPAFSPDGQSLALVLSKSGAPKIHLLNLKTKALKQLTKGWSIDTEPVFSPDGTRVYFTSNRGGRPQIYAVNLSSKNIMRQTYQGNYNAGATLSPKGKTMVMLHREDRLFSIAKQTGNDVVVLAKTNFDESPSFAPNGQMIVYATEKNGRKLLSLVSIDGQVQIRLPASDGDVKDPAWSPFL